MKNQTCGVAERLGREGQARFFCAAGIGANINVMVESVRGASRVLVLDGCPAEYAKKCMDQAGLSGYIHLVVTNLGIKKNYNFSLAEKNLDHVMSACREKGVALPSHYYVCEKICQTRGNRLAEDLL